MAVVGSRWVRWMVISGASPAKVWVSKGQQNHQLRISKDHSKRWESREIHSQIQVKLVKP